MAELLYMILVSDGIIEDPKILPEKIVENYHKI